MNDEDLQLLRNEIDRIDTELIALLNARYKTVEAIGEYKRERHLPIYDPSRQRKLMERLQKLNQGPMTPEILHAVYREIMSGANLIYSSCSGTTWHDWEGHSPAFTTSNFGDSFGGAYDTHNQKII